MLWTNNIRKNVLYFFNQTEINRYNFLRLGQSIINMNNNYINNEAEFEQFVNSTLNYDNNNRSSKQDIYDFQITSILKNLKNQLMFTRLFAYYFINRAITNDYTYSSTCCVCMDTNNYCIKICDCSQVKYCFKCFKEYVKTSILADPIKINKVINDWHSQEQKLDMANIISCSICHLSPMLGLMDSVISNSPQYSQKQKPEIGSYLHSLDFFSESVPSSGEQKWYLLFNQDGRIRYNLVQLENLELLNNNNDNKQSGKNTQTDEDDETRLRMAGMIYIFEINRPSPTEHQEIKRILNKCINESTEHTKMALQKYNPSRLKLL